ncbi:polysaccharide lyase family 8 super-sandwich domain-containing protein [Nonomuraea sp. NPDC051941]|uniref:polysaccharide lyase family 8 super-sandwich domain-containing protein n=1 Tax=Nonomuraea sp. NPDC051941 TaxID=3364373 RepID=UPI0037C63623
MALTRRTFLTAATAAATLGLAAPARAEDAFDAARLRWTGMIAGGAFDPGDPDFAAKVAAVDSAAASLRASMSPDPARPSLWPGLPLDDPRTGNFSRAYSQVRGMALGWATPGTRMHGDAAFAADVVSALDFLYEHAYNERLERQNSNWFWWEIGVPRSLTDTCALLYEDIPAGRLDVWFGPLLRWCPDADHRISNATITETGANRTNKAMAVAMRGVLTRDATAIELARDGISDKLGGGRWSLLKLTEGPRDGFYRDGSFIQHEFYPYTGAYGTDHLDGVARLITLYAGSPWDIADPDVVNVFDIVDRSFIPVIYDGLMMDMVRGRQISVQGWRDTDAGQKALEGILILLEGAPRAYAERWRPVIKGWVTRNTVHPFLARAGLPAVRQAKAILNDAAVPTGPRTEGTYVFADMDRVVHRRPTWAYAISMCSERIGAAEGINLENLHGWYTGDGMTRAAGPDGRRARPVGRLGRRLRHPRSHPLRRTPTQHLGGTHGSRTQPPRAARRHDGRPRRPAHRRRPGPGRRRPSGGPHRLRLDGDLPQLLRPPAARQDPPHLRRRHRRAPLLGVRHRPQHLPRPGLGPA